MFGGVREGLLNDAVQGEPGRGFQRSKLAVDVRGPEIVVDARLRYADDGAAKAAEKAAHDGIALARGKLQEAKDFARQAAEGGHKVLGSDNPDTKRYERLLQELE